MWLFTTHGFYSVVNNPRVKGEVMIRGRVYDDMVALKEVIPELSEITFTTHSDYTCRAFCSKEAWVKGMTKLAEDMDYTNFKNTILARQGSDRYHIYSGVWTAARRLEKLCKYLDAKLTPGKNSSKAYIASKTSNPRTALYTTDRSGAVVPIRKPDAENGVDG